MSDARDTLEFFKKRLTERIGHYTEAAASGQCKDFSDYQFLCGRVKSFREIMQLVDEVIRKIEIGDGEGD